MLELKGINKSYKDKQIFQNYDLKIDDGEMIAIKGQSGSGKTTLIRILSLMDNDFSGEYLIDGIDVSNIKNRNKIRIDNFSVVYQNYNLIEYLTAYENVSLALKLAKRKIDNQLIDELFEKYNLKDVKNKVAGTLSGGEAQRVAIIRALVTKPKYIIADEPTGNLDEINTKIVMDSFKEINKNGVGIVMVTHSNELDSYFDRIIKVLKNE
ncbi:MAG: ABC transporter ATP-binding protein [Acholeplasmatales bacterium]|nr:ABC transporter ATP-binding protein [Acholeplasmatales bacterium]